MTILTDIIRVLGQAQRILLVSHVSPDFDTVGSCLALKLALETQGKSVCVHNAKELPPNMLALPGAESVTPDLEGLGPFDVTVLLDSSTSDRFGPVLDGDRGWLGTLVKIDHHLNGEAFTELDYTDPQRASTAELVYDLIRAWPIPLSRDMALNIYVALVSDTGGFRYSNTNSQAFAVAAEMLAFGLSAWEVTTLLYENRPLAELRLLAETLNTLVVSDCGRYASLLVTQEALQRTGAKAHMTDGFVNFARSVQGVEVAMLLHESPEGNRYRVSFRSKGMVNVAAIAESMGGGGHHNAAGCTLTGPLEEVRNRLHEMAARNLDALSSRETGA